METNKDEKKHISEDQIIDMKWEAMQSLPLDIERDVKKQKRTVKPLPPELDNIGPNSLSRIHCAVEVYRNDDKTVEHSVAQYLECEVDENEVRKIKRIDLRKDLNLCQLRRFCRQLGIKQTASSNKDACRRAIALLIDYEKQLLQNGVHPRSTEARARNTLLRSINVVFSPCFVDRFLSLNDAKNRMDHETGQMMKNFWEDAVDCHNDFDDSDICKDVILNSSDDKDFKTLLNNEYIAVDLEDSDNLTAATLQKKIMTLIKIRQVIQQNMVLSGTHSTRVLDFLDHAINKTRGGRMLNRLGVYYFFIRAEEYGDLLDSAFQPFLNDNAKGCTAQDLLTIDSESSLTTDDPSETRSPPVLQSKRKRIRYGKQNEYQNDVTHHLDMAVGAITALGQESKTMAVEMKRSNDIEEHKVKLEEHKVKIEELKVKMEIAKALGDIDTLRKLLAEH